MGNVLPSRWKALARAALLFGALGPLAGILLVTAPLSLDGSRWLEFLAALPGLLFIGLPFAYVIQGVPAATTGLFAGWLCGERVTWTRALIVVGTGALLASWPACLDFIRYGFAMDQLTWPVAGGLAAGICLAVYVLRSNNSFEPTSLRDPGQPGR